MGFSFPIPGVSARVSKVHRRIKTAMPAPTSVRRGAHRLKSALPKRLQAILPGFNFIGVHYAYLIGFTIVGSILLYPAGLLSYTDALFFAAGCSTQSGLNPIDLNRLDLYQQIVIYLIPIFTNPIFINTFVVFVRLYWFERRFHRVVAEARRTRRSRTRSMSVSESRDAPDFNRLEQGVDGRVITVLHHTTRPNGMSGKKSDGDPSAIDAEKAEAEKLGIPAAPSDESAVDDSASTLPDDDGPEQAHFLGRNPALKRDIVFADEVSRDQEGAGPDSRSGHAEDTERHIRFLEKQRDKNQSTLRIPGPRDFERGDKPTELPADSAAEDDETGDLVSPRTAAFRQDSSERTAAGADPSGGDDKTREITFADPRRPSKDAADDKSGLHKTISRLSHARAPSLSRSVMSLRDRTRSITTSMTQNKDTQQDMPYFSWQPTMGRNSAFMDLSMEQRDELGGIEYRSLKTMFVVLLCYFIGFHLLGALVLWPWIARSGTWGPVVDRAGVSRAWWGFFTSATLFNDLGFTLTPDSFISFQEAVVPLLLGSFLIVIGNTGFPCMLRFVIWVASKLVPQGSPVWEELRFLLDHPRRCFTLMFPARATWILFAVLVLLNGIDLIFFIVLDINAEAVKQLSAGTKVLDGLFQAVSTRTAGTAVVNLAELHPAIQVSYLIMMYISVFPIAISVRRTNVYEENSLGVYPGEDETDGSGKSYVGQHLRRQLSFDLWYIFLGLFIITIVEGHRIQTNDISIFAILFEIVSAYGTVGLSLGYPTINASLSAEFKVLSKLVIVAMMLRGRHRGLPYALDRAILLPSEKLNRREQEEGNRQLNRRTSSLSAGTPGGTRSPVDAHAAWAADRSWPASPSAPDATSPPDGTKARSRRGGDLRGRSSKRRLSHAIVGALSAGPQLKDE